MAPMDKYTRLVGGAVHGLSCFHSAQCVFAPLIKPGNNGNDSEKTRLFKNAAIRPHHKQK